ncbi:MAG: hypothetical protein ABJK46_07465 [Ekhidna sp.]
MAYRGITISVPNSASERIRLAKLFLSKAERGLIRPFRVTNVYWAYKMVDGGGSDNIEDIASDPNRKSDFLEMIQTQYRILSDPLSNDLILSGHSYEHRMSFFRENLYQNLATRVRDHELCDRATGYHTNSKKITDFSFSKLDFLVNSGIDEIKKHYS